MSDEIEKMLQEGLALHRGGRVGEAEGVYLRVIERWPGCGDAWHLRGYAVHQMGRWEEGVGMVQKAIELGPGVGIYRHTLGNMLVVMGRVEEGIAQFEKACEINPRDWGSMNNLGNALARMGRKVEAAGVMEKILAANPEDAEVHNNLGTILKDMGRMGGAVVHYQRSAELRPELPQPRNNLGSALVAMGAYEEGIAVIRKLLEVHPGYVRADSNLMMMLNYISPPNPEVIYQQHRRWEGAHMKRFYGEVNFANDREPERVLRVGYVSPDFYDHVVAYFIEPVIAGHDRTKVEVYLYSDTAWEDPVTERIKGMATAWRNIGGVSSEMAAEMIRGDGVDVLVDLFGHTRGERLEIFARRPAPVQVSYLGYPNTTGMEAMGWRVTDEVADPVGKTEGWHAERLMRLNRTMWAYRPPVMVEGNLVPPGEGKGVVTFGCFNALAKLSEATLDLWARVLKGVPGSRLLVKSMGLEDVDARAYLAQRLARRMVDLERVEVMGKQTYLTEHLAAYNKVDVALDTFPYNGTTTTCEAMLMGVPVVTLAGEAHVSRVGASMLHAMGMGEWVAKSPEEFVRKAVELGTDWEKLKRVREGLRGRFMGSPLCDGVGLARELERGYREAWREWGSHRGHREH